MRTTKYVLFGALGIAALLLLTSDKAKKLRDDLEEKALSNAGKWKGKLGNLGIGANKTLSELRELLNADIEGLSEHARERIEAILNRNTASANGLKNNVASPIS